MRIVSLLPSATEIVCALGLADALVGVSGDCDYPPEVRQKTVLSDAMVTADLPSPAIDRRIRHLRHAGKSVYHLDSVQLARLRPDLILTQEQCAVCAPSYSLVTQAARMVEADARIVSLEPRGVRDILETIRLVGEWREADLLTALPGWDDLPAVRDGRVYLTDASSYINRPGPRIVDGLAILAAIVNPTARAADVSAGAMERL
jgi:ABC-type Fe3+-hydroxamate transport system substrate-binding protein